MKDNKKTFIISELLINKTIYNFLYSLIKNIFLKEAKNYDKVKFWIDIINKKFIKKENKYITDKFNKRNFENILDFIKSQNREYAGDILEGILINVFSRAFEADTDETFGKYIYKNLSKISSNTFNYFFKLEKFKNEIEILNIENILKLDEDKTNTKENILNYEEPESDIIIYDLEIQNKRVFKKLYLLLNNIAEEKNKMVIKNGFNYKINISYSRSMTMDSYLIKNNSLLIRDFFISVFIYYQNKNSPLMKYIPVKDNQKDKLDENSLAYVPFSYDLRDAEVSGNSSIISPIKIEPRITNILLDKNDLREIGMLELGKVLIFNKGIKCLSNNHSLLKTRHLEYFSHLIEKNDNYTLEELHLSDNFLKENSGEYLSKLLSHLKGLKTLNLSFNDLKSGLASSFVVLRKLYRKGKSKLENLYLKNCTLNEESIFELGELLQCKFCKLKTLCLNMNSLVKNKDFLKKIKKNKSLEELYLNQSDIGNNEINDILRIINLTNIKTLYLYKTKITDFNKLLTILYRTKIIKEDMNNLNINLDEETSLTNLDLSSNVFNNKTENHIVLLTKIIKETSLNCLDISNILSDGNNDYNQKIEELIKILQEDKEKYKEYMVKLRRNNIDVERNKCEKDLIQKIKKKYKENKIDENKNDEEIFKNFEDEIEQIYKNDKAKHIIFLKKQAIGLINKYKEILNFEKSENIMDRLVNYMKYLRDDFYSDENKKKLKGKKLILI